MDYLGDNSARTSSGQEVVKQWGDFKMSLYLIKCLFPVIFIDVSSLTFVIAQLGSACVLTAVINTVSVQ